MNNVEQAKHTAPPWIVYKGPMNMDGGLNPLFRGIVCLLKNSGEGEEIAVVLDRNEEAHDYEANARLIAAAPELYEFASAFLEWAENHAGIFTWVEHPGEPSSLLAADEGWIGLIGMADEATAAARHGVQA